MYRMIFILNWNKRNRHTFILLLQSNGAEMKFTLFKISSINTDIKFFIVNMYNYLARALYTHEALSCTCSYFYVLFMIKEPSAVSKRECSDSVFDWLSIFWSVTLECSAETRHESVHCFQVVVSELHHPCLPDPEKINENKWM